MRNEAKKAGLADHEIDLLVDLYKEGNAIRVLCKFIDDLVKKQELRLVSMSSTEGAEKLFHTKLRAEGARKLLSEIQSLLP